MAARNSGVMCGGVIAGVKHEFLCFCGIKEEAILCAPLCEGSDRLLVGCDLVLDESEYGHVLFVYLPYVHPTAASLDLQGSARLLRLDSDGQREYYSQ